MRFAGALTPAQAAAFWRLRLLHAGDLSRLAMAWLEEGATSDRVAVLASERDVTLRDHAPLFEAALAELDAPPNLGEKEATWIVVQTLLQAVESGALDPFDAAHDLIVLEREGVEIFPVRGLASGGQPFVGEALGIEGIVGCYYQLDDCDLSAREAEHCMNELRAECTRVLSVWYTVPPEFAR